MSPKPEKVTSLEEWGARKRHQITLPSGAQVEIELPNVPLLVKIGRIPNNLIEATLKLQTASKVTREMVAEEVDYVALLVAVTLKDPSFSEEEVKDAIYKELLPYEDVEMIVEFATRARDMDAVGHHFGDLELVESFREVRGL